MGGASEARCRVCGGESLMPFLAKDEFRYLRCRECAATLMASDQLPTPMVELEKYRQHQNDPQDQRYRSFLNRLAAPLLLRLGPRQTGLDYGCGPGPALAQMLSQAGHEMHLYDPSFFPDRKALERTYDFIACSEVAEHFHQPLEEFTKLHRMLRPRGVLAIMTNFQTEDSRFADWHYRRDPTHVTFYREETFQVIARRFDMECDIPSPNVVFLRKKSGD
ncbi:MAG: class I SAM-dependent methyltransferase [Planctomycetes bacterium]|nr:class I SAM-dependent methyltransferase [Planctomycetota bacterium]